MGKYKSKIVAVYWADPKLIGKKGKDIPTVRKLEDDLEMKIFPGTKKHESIQPKVYDLSKL